ncbi:MAG TPA: serine protease [Chthoniobacter sp.]|jgi:S1-C subfamily serine protease
MFRLPVTLLFTTFAFLGAVSASDQLVLQNPKTSAATTADKSKAKTAAEKLLQPRTPVAGQPFDDREIELYFQAESQKLYAAKRITPLHFTRKVCGLHLADPLPEKLSGPTIAARAEAATLVLGEFSRESKKGAVQFNVAGGAFMIAPGVCLTSLHVAKDKTARGFCALTRDGRVFPVRDVLAFEPVNDLAVLQLDLPEGVDLPALPIAREAAPAGSPVFVMSHPDDRFFLLSTGYVARHTLWKTEAGVEAFMSITADFAKGSSGCPVLDDHGTVIGIVNNTESIYYDDDGHRKQLDLQMVVKNATPSWAVLPLVEGDTKAASVSSTSAGKP